MTTPPPARPAPSYGLAIASVVAHVGLLMAVFALYAFIVPAAKRKFDEFGLVLPWLTITVVRLSNWVAEYWWALVPTIPALGAADFGLTAWLSTHSRRGALAWVLCGSLALGSAVAVTTVAIELPSRKLNEALAR